MRRHKIRCLCNLALLISFPFFEFEGLLSDINMHAVLSSEEIPMQTNLSKGIRV
jgi:hypothetical protein